MVNVELFVGATIAITGAISTLLGVSCYNWRRMRCTTVDCCCGAVKCVRQVMTAQELQSDGLPGMSMTDNPVAAGTASAV